ncbi:MAG TPA: hypothetical protein VKZ59_06300, partial [Acidobacteriota bacterium]|nr:hypothetical protein [Acidobacteriota bacterium]
MNQRISPLGCSLHSGLRRNTVSLLLALLLITPLAGQEILIRNATVMTVSQGTYDRASILIRDGKIAAVGTDIAAPQGAEIVDASGK